MKLKLSLLLCGTILYLSCISQTIEFYSDYRGKKVDASLARYFTRIKNTDSGWLRMEYFLREQKVYRKGLFTDSACKVENGQFVEFYPSGRLASMGAFINNKREGLWLRFHDNSMMKDSVIYKNGRQLGAALGWYDNGYLRDSIVRNEDESGVRIEWFDNGSPSAAGKYGSGGNEAGKWKFYHRNGNIAANIIYQDGKILQKEFFDEAGKRDTTADGENKEAQFKGGLSAWRKHLEKNLVMPTQYTITGADQVTILLRFVVDEEGKVSNVHVIAPFHPAYDDMAENVLRKSPKWEPAMHFNRRVKAYRTQPITFQQVR